MDTLAAADPLGPAAVTLYEELAPVYDFVSARLYDYDAVAQFVDTHTPADVESVAVGACGSGHLLTRLADDHETVVGIDLSQAMLALCADRTDAHLVRADLTTFVAPERFDVLTVLGGSVAHLPTADEAGTDGVVSLFENAAESLRPGGVFCCDFMEAGALESGCVVTDSYESERFRVDRTVITTGEPARASDLGGMGRFTYAYEITDRDTGESVRTSTAVPAREFDPGAMLGSALAAGFDDVTLVTPPTHGSAVVARRAD